MTRIPAVSPDEAGPLIKLSYRWAKRRFGEVPEPFAVTANHRKLFLANVIAEAVVGKASMVLPANVRDLAVYRVAWTIGCSWCVDFGTMLVRLDGLDVDRLKEIDDYATSPVYTDDERAALMCTKPGFLDSRLHRALSSQIRFQLINVAHWESHGRHRLSGIAARISSPFAKTRMSSLSVYLPLSCRSRKEMVEAIKESGTRRRRNVGPQRKPIRGYA